MQPSRSVGGSFGHRRGARGADLTAEPYGGRMSIPTTVVPGGRVWAFINPPARPQPPPSPPPSRLLPPLAPFPSPPLPPSDLLRFFTDFADQDGLEKRKVSSSDPPITLSQINPLVCSLKKVHVHVQNHEDP